MKICTKCKISKGLEEFCRDKNTKDGRAYTCKSCRSTYRKVYNNKAKTKISAYNRDYHLKNRSEICKRHKNDKNNKMACRKWSQNNKHIVNEIAAKKRARKRNQTPFWADLDSIRLFYKNCPKGYHVDHIIPLKGKNVTGLHVLSNLQYLTAKDNIKKGNKYVKD